MQNSEARDEVASQASWCLLEVSTLLDDGQLDETWPLKDWSDERQRKGFLKTGQGHYNLWDQRTVLGGICPNVLIDSSLFLMPSAFVCQNLTLFFFNIVAFIPIFWSFKPWLTWLSWNELLSKNWQKKYFLRFKLILK